MEQKINKVNFKSDFDFTAVFKAFGQGGVVEIGFANYDWEIVLTTGGNHLASRGYVVSYKGGVCTNCFNDNGKVHIVMNNHKLDVGQLQGTIKANIPNPIYPDGHQLLMNEVKLPYELVTGNGDAPTEVEVEILLPYLYDSAYRIAVASGYKGTQEQYYALANELPNAVETANKVQASADSLADSAETIGGAIETLATTTDAIEQGANVIKDNADTLQKSADIVKQSATKVEQAVEPLVQASESLDATKQAFEMLSSEWSDGRQAIATALTNRRYPTEPTESFHAMADKITNMSYEEGWFAKIGYTDENDGGLKEAIDYSYELAKGWDPDGSTGLMFRENRRLVFAPMVDISKYTSLANMFNGCVALSTIPLLDTSNITSMMNMFYGCAALSTIPPLDTSNVTNMSQMFYNCASLSFIPQLDTRNVTTMQQMTRGTNYLIRIEGLYLDKVTAHQFAYGNYSIVFAKFYNLGMSSLVTHDFSQMFNWGTGSEENRQSLIDSLITYSYDRASNGMATATIKLSANTKALLTEEEIAQITQKGYTIA